MKDSLQADAVSAPAARKWFDRRMFGRAHSNDCLVADGLLQSKSPCDAEEDACTNEPSSSEDSDSSCQEDTLGDGGNEVQSRKVAIRKKSVTRDSKNEMKDEPRKLKYSKGDPLKSDSDIVPTSRRSKKKKLPTRSDLTRERRGVDRSYSMDSMNMRIMSQGNIGNVRRGSRKPRMTEGRRSSEIGKLERESSCLRIAIDPEKHTDISNAAIVPKLAPPRQIVRTESIRRKKVRNVEEESEWEECMTDGEEAVFDRRCHRTIHKTRKSRVNRSMSLDCTPTKSDDLGNGNKDLLATYGLSKMQPKLEDENVFGSLFHNEASWLDERNMTSLISGKTKTLSGTDKFSSAAEIALQRPSAVQHPKLPATGSGQLSRRS